ncbi:TonB-dependent siderophore receptor [Metapseudomonas resinovorans]|uniref:Putative TonB-dependent siderophore receptor n=1 Tax=Metapseudomonas resinovorans NBRC 106553 TaxID=1245471 RepID=S6ACT7_METRE|nr:TonB-dependent siderophore receptor [Pseudomonas resinovorans]BAN46712.1 putative TonB-dependent siderophore receptor [Pseudomonas resinovorans NBRC 106553]
MTQSTAVSRTPQRHLLATTIGIALFGIDLGAQAEEQGRALHLDDLSIEGRQEKTYRPERSASAKYAVPLLDTPQTITVVPREVIRDQQALSLRQVLSNVSGITFNAGEGGGGSGDSINIRGFSANANMQIDGLRDSAQNNRTDSFNIEQVEVIKGPSSVFGGSGTTGGTINQITKQPMAERFTDLGASLGTDRYRRLTLDTNQPLDGVGHGSAFRLNLMAHENDVPERDHIDRQRWGVAPSLALGFSEDTRLTLSYFHQRDDNLPDYGVPTANGKRMAGVSRDAYFGWRNLDKEEIRQDAFTVKLEHQFNERLSLQSLTRYAEVHRDTVISAAHVNVDGMPPGRYLPAGPQAYGRDVDSRMWISQTSLTSEFDTIGFGHTLVGGVELSRETYSRDTYSYNLVFPASGYPLASPPGYWSGPTNRATSAKVDTRLIDRALFLFDTIALSEQWDLSLGLRYDWVDGDAENLTLTRGSWVPTRFSSSDERLSGRAGLVFKPVENGRIYVAYGDSFNPSAENLVTSGAGLTAATEDLGPEKNRSWELGTKWELLDSRLGLEGALFRVEKTNARETMVDGSTALAGERRVQGVELAANGRITEQWAVFANFTFLDSETTDAANTPAGLATEGQALANTPPRSFNLWTTYDLPEGFRVGYGARYVSERNLTSSNDGIKLDAFWLHNAMLGYKVSETLDLQLNLNNLFDKDYVERVRTVVGNAARSSAVEYGDARSAVMTATLSF